MGDKSDLGAVLDIVLNSAMVKLNMQGLWGLVLIELQLR